MPLAYVIGCFYAYGLPIHLHHIIVIVHPLFK
jgi:hypothetical protein